MATNEGNETEQTATPEVEAETSTTETEVSTEATSATGSEGEKSLGDAGKKALDAMKAKWKDAEAKAKAADAEKAALQAKLDGKEAEHQAEQESQRIKDEALAAANARILKAEVRAAAAAKLADPTDALLHIDLSPFEVGEDGEVDSSAIAAAIDDLITKKPYLAAQGGSKFQGSADGGARNGASQPSQLSEADVQRMAADGKHAEIEQARLDGRLSKLLGA